MFKTIINPRVSETDGVGHINNTFIPVWFEAGRNEIFKIFNPDDSFDDWKMVIINTNITYRNQIYFGSDAIVKCWIKNVGTTSLTLYEEIWQNEKICATSETVYVNFNKMKGKSEEIPDHIRTILNTHYIEKGDHHE